MLRALDSSKSACTTYLRSNVAIAVYHNIVSNIQPSNDCEIFITCLRLPPPLREIQVGICEKIAIFNVFVVRILRQPSVKASPCVTVPCTTSPGKSGIWWYQSRPGPPISDVFNVRGDDMDDYRRSGRFALRRDSDVDYSLVIKNISLSDAGYYTCIIDDGYGDHCVTRLSVAGSPVTGISSSIRCVQQGVDQSTAG